MEQRPTYRAGFALDITLGVTRTARAMNKPAKKSLLAEHPSLVLLITLFAAAAVWTSWLWFGVESVHKRIASLSGQHAASSPSSQASGASVPLQQADRQTYFTEVGLAGDSFGGLNALLTAIAGALVAWAGFMQYLSLRESREENREERRARQRQEFESLFFRMLDLSRDLTERIQSSSGSYLLAKGPVLGDSTRSGAAALDSFAANMKQGWKEGVDAEEAMRGLVQHFRKHAYNANPSAFGPYFRLLFQTFKHVAESSLEEKEKIQYANIARGQISEGAVLLLALNGLTPFGHRFIRYIEEFGLLEHMHTGYHKAYKAALQTGYRPRAFLGSKERAAYPLEIVPMHGPKHFVQKQSSEESTPPVSQ